jgi:autotransporter-associated beta strand protein
MNGSRSAGNITMNATSFDYFMSGNPGNQLNLSVPSGTPFIDVVSSSRTLTIVSGNGLGGSQGFEKRGAGELDILGASSYTGTTILTAGTLKIGTTTSLGAVPNPLTINGGTLDLFGQSPTVGNLTGTGGTITSTSATSRTLTIGGGNGTGGNYQGVIQNGSGTTSLTKIGTGTIALSGANTYTGATTINAGTLQIGNGTTTGSLSTSSSITTNGTLAFNRSNTVTQGTNFNSVIGGTGGVSQVGTGTLILNGSNTFTGTLAVTQGTLQVATLNNANTVGPLGNSSLAIQLGGSGTTGTLDYTGGTITSNRSFTAVSGGTGRISIGPGTKLTFNGTLRPDGNLLLDGPGNSVISSPMSSLGTGTLTKNGTGTLTLSSTGAHSGAFVINQGTLDIVSNTAFTNATSLTLGSGVTLDNSTSGLIAVANTSMTKTLGDSITYLGTGGYNLSLGAGATALTSNITFNVLDQALNFVGPMYGSGFTFDKNGDGMLRVTALASGAFSGNSTISAGTFRVAGTSVLGPTVRVTVADYATLDAEDITNLGGATVVLSEFGNLIVGNGTTADVVFAANRTLTLESAHTNGSQTIEPNVVITSIADWLGTVPASPVTGRIVMQDGATLVSTGSININENKGIALTGSSATFVTNNGTIIVNPQVTGSGKLVASGSSSHFIDIEGTGNTYAGGTDILSGVLGIMGDGSLGADGTSVFINDGAMLASGQSSLNGTVTVSGNRSVLLANGGTSRLAARTFSSFVVNGVIDEQFVGPDASVAVNEFGVREGTVVLGGANLYGGDTIVTAGRLLVNNTTGSGTGSGNVIVSAGATLGGTGSIAGSVTIQGGATLSPGASIASLASGSVAFENDSSFLYEIDSSVLPSAGADLQIVSGNLAIGSDVVLDLDDLAAVPVALPEFTTIFTLFNYSGTWNGGLFEVDGNAIADGGTFTVGLNTWQLDYNASAGGANFSGQYVHANFVNIIAVPEPPVAAMLAAGGVAGWLIRRRVTHGRR